MEFSTLGLSQTIIDALAQMGITQPTAVQEAAIPLLLDGKDVMLQSQTGSGKTLAYLLPIYQRQADPVEKGAQVIILAPTRELVMQIHHQVQQFSKASNIDLRSVALFGNVNINGQIEKLREKPQIIVGTGDRILNLIQKKKLPAHLVKTLIVDEADKLLDPQSLELLKAVRKTLMKQTQLVFASATYLPQSIRELKAMAPDVVMAEGAGKEGIPDNIQHLFLVTQPQDKLKTLCKLIGTLRPHKSIIFINNLEQMDDAVEAITRRGIACAAIHSESTKEERKRCLEAFQAGTLQHLVATDLVARGLHVEDVDYIFNVNIAEDPIDYLHRSGRTGRNGAPGISLSLPTPKELTFLGKCKSRYDLTLEERALVRGQLVAQDGREARKKPAKKS